jgi:hypothetical protein
MRAPAERNKDEKNLSRKKSSAPEAHPATAWSISDFHGVKARRIWQIFFIKSI